MKQNCVKRSLMNETRPAAAALAALSFSLQSRITDSLSFDDRGCLFLKYGGML